MNTSVMTKIEVSFSEAINVHKTKNPKRYEWWREQETNEYDVDTDYFYTPDYVVNINDISSLDRPTPDRYI